MAAFDRKALIVTGAGGGIGAAVVRLAVERGARVLAADVRAETVEELAGSLGDAVVPHAVDVTDPAACEAMVAAAVASFGRLDAGLNVHGVTGGHGPVHEIDLDDWRRVLTINLDGAFYCMRAEAPAILASGGGSIVNFASTAGLVGQAQVPHYTAAKHGVVGLTRSASLLYGEQGLRVNAVVPGGIATPINAAWRETDDFRLNQPMRRAGEPEEVAELTLFLASDASSFCNGGIYTVDGGYTAR